MTAAIAPENGLKVFLGVIANGLFEITHNGFSLLGLALVFGSVMLTARPDLREAGEQQLRGWLHARLAADVAMVAEDTSDRALAANPRELPREQAAVAYWLAKKYRVAPEPLSVIVAEAYDIGKRTRLDPTLLLAVMAIESSFNPFAQSSVGAQGLMQVMTRVHTDKYQNSGGPLAAFNPVTNLRVGAKVLLDCLARAGTIEGALKYYVGAANLQSDGGYAAKVLAERARLKQVASGRVVPLEYLEAEAAAASARMGNGEKLASLTN